MRNSQTGEYELVVGNRQVVSAFFVVAVLLGVMFAMGYVVGSNAPRSAKPPADAAAAAAPAAGGETRPQAVAPSAAPSSVQPSDASAQPPSDSPSKPANPEPPPQPTTQPAREAAPPPPAVAETPGSYWQVGAFKATAEAQPILQTLKDGGMPATLKVGADGWVRVIVGPYPDTKSLSDAKTKLETVFGIKNPIHK